ncbi:LysR family transcriptional regulator [Dyella acidisoli]|uniref:LysR family transcriptional regulator n=1 Tax=Dyella acidisoli TaxID=1867834 RepID=A0ABQ5XRJ8_9GAMM|nr:LysR family transcriptional regulator [Dyella acidisoli]GLQ94376.1 LysR family transcriptional regulator [Dyella acidisoli]
MDLKHLRLIRAVAERGGLTAAGRELYLSQPALSQQLANIEADLGVQLFHRIGKRMVPTAAGKLAVEMGEGLLAGMQHLEERLRQNARGVSCELRLGIQCYTALHWLPSVMAGFHRAHRHVELKIISDATHEPERALLEGRIDVGVLNGQVRDPRLVIKKLFDDELVVICAASHRFAKRQCVTPEDLIGEQVFVYSTPRDHAGSLDSLLSPVRGRLGRLTEIQWTDPIIAFASEGMGVGIVPNWVVSTTALRKKIRYTRFMPEGLRRTWSAATLATASVPEPAAHFVQALVNATQRMHKSSRRR